MVQFAAMIESMDGSHQGGRYHGTYPPEVLDRMQAIKANPSGLYDISIPDKNCTTTCELGT